MIELVPLDYPNRFVYDVPGDGFCALHSVLACFRELRYLENVAYFEKRGQLNILEK